MLDRIGFVRQIVIRYERAHGAGWLQVEVMSEVANVSSEMCIGKRCKMRGQVARPEVYAKLCNTHTHTHTHTCVEGETNVVRGTRESIRLLARTWIQSLSMRQTVPTTQQDC